MTRLTRILILVASFLPFPLAAILAFLLLSGPHGASTWIDEHDGSLVAALIALHLSIVAFYVWHLKQWSNIPRAQHGRWIARFIFFRGPFAVADYWYKNIWDAPRGTP